MGLGVCIDGGRSNGRYAVSGILILSGGAMSKHKKVERKKELDRKRRRREKSLKLRAKEERAAAKHK